MRKFAPFIGLCPRPRVHIAVIVAAVTAICVAQKQAHAQTAAAPTSHASAATMTDRITVETIGSGPDVVLIPGFASSREVWRAEATRLSATHRVHLVQLAGFAGQPWTHGDGPVIQPAVDALAAYVAILDRPAVIGHSMGGLMALMLAEQHPQAASRVMTVDALPFFSAMFGPSATPDSAGPFAAQAAASVLSADEAAFRQAQSRTAASLSRTPATQAAMVEWSMTSDRQAMATAIAEDMTADVRPGLPSIAAPVTALYASDADGGAPAALADGLWSREYAALPGVKLVRIDGSRHFIMADQPERFAAEVDAFLR